MAGVVVPTAVIASVRRRGDVRPRTKDPAVLQGVIRKSRTQDTHHSARPIRDVPYARLRVFVAEVECKTGSREKRLKRHSFSSGTTSGNIKSERLRERGIFRCYSRGDLFSLFRNRSILARCYSSSFNCSLARAGRELSQVTICQHAHHHPRAAPLL
jgi:hypothetical protein